MGPENTLGTAAKGFRSGAQFWELDVQLSLDGVPVVIHDDTLVRTTDAPILYPDRHPWQVWDFTWAELRALRIVPTEKSRSQEPEGGLDGSPHRHGLCGAEDRREPIPPDSRDGKKVALSETPTAALPSEEDRLSDRLFGSEPSPMPGLSWASCRIPTLREALVLTRSLDWLVNVEIKGTASQHDRLVRETVALIAELEMSSRVLISSFHETVLRLVSSLDSHLLTGLVTQHPVDDPVARVRALGTFAYHPAEAHLDAETVHRCRAAGIPVIAWTVNDPEKLPRLRRWGVSAVISDRPHKLLPETHLEEDSH